MVPGPIVFGPPCGPQDPLFSQAPLGFPGLVVVLEPRVVSEPPAIPELPCNRDLIVAFRPLCGPQAPL